MNSILTIILTFLFPALLIAQEIPKPDGALRGTVSNKESRQRLAGATISLDGTKLGCASDENGEFSLSDVPPESYTAIVRLLGFEDVRVEHVRVRSGETTILNVTMTETPIPLAEMQIIAERIKRQEDIRASVLTVEPFRAKTLPGVGEDVLRTLQSLPGVLSPNDFTSQLVVRGSGPDQNLIIMDDIEIFNPYRLYGMISMFNPETAAEINLTTGGFPAKYGDRLSAVLDVRNREGDKSSAIRGSLNASITNANIVLNGRLPMDIPGSYVVSARRTYYDLILGPIAKHTGLVSGDVAFPNFVDFQNKLTFEPGAGHKIVANILLSKDGVDLMTGADRSIADSVNVVDRTRNDVYGLSWQYVPSNKYFSKMGISWYRNRGDTEFGGDFIDPALNRDKFENRTDTTGIRLYNVEFDSRYIFRKLSFKEEMGWLLPGQIIETGLGIDHLANSLIWHFRPDETFRAIMRSRGIASIDDFVQDRDYLRMNMFLQDKIMLGGGFSVQPGARVDYYEVIGKAYLQPRLNVSYAIDALTTVRAAWGVYRQSPGYEKLLDQNAFLDLTGAGSGTLNAERAIHYVLGVDRWLTNEWQVKVEGYYKKFDDVIVQEYLPGTTYQSSPVPGGDPFRRSGWSTPVAVVGDSLTTLPVNGATGRSFGVEILIEKRNIDAENRLNGWVSYAFARAERIRDGIITPFRFDQRHTVNVVIDYRLNSWLDVGIRWKYGTNFPYTQPLGLKPRVVTAMNNGVETKVVQVDSQGKVVFDIDRGGEANRYQAQLPAYHRLDVRFTARAGYWGLDWNFYLDVINAYNHANVLNYRFFAMEDLSLGKSAVNMLPIIPTLGFSVRF